MEDSEIYDYMIDIAERLEVLSNVLSFSGYISVNSSVNEPVKLKVMLDSIICDELLAMSGKIIDDINK